MSRPIRLAFETRVIEQDDTVLDYGCGHGEDLRALEGNGIEAFGWDPVHIPEGELRAADIVNLSYVINVIESPTERREVLRAAWGYARKALVVAVRTDNEARTLSAATPRGDGWVTSKRTFQRFYGQAEARDWLDETFGVKTVPLSVGVLVAFKEDLRLVAGSLAQSGQQIEQECPNGADRVVADAFDDPEGESGLFDRNERDRIVQHPVGGHQAAVLQLMQRHDHGVVVEFGEARIDVGNRHQPHFGHRGAEQHEQRRRKIVVERHRHRFARAHRLRRR